MSNAELFIKYFLALLTATCEPFSMLLSTNQGTVIFLVVAWLGKFIWIASQVLQLAPDFVVYYISTKRGDQVLHLKLFSPFLCKFFVLFHLTTCT